MAGVAIGLLALSGSAATASGPTTFPRSEGALDVAVANGGNYELAAMA